MSTFTVIKRIFDFVRPHRVLLIFSFLMSILSVGATLGVPLMLGVGIDALFSADYSKLGITMGFLFALIGCGSIVQWAQNVCMYKVSYKTIQDMRNATYEKIHTISVAQLDTLQAGDFSSRIVNDIDLVGDGFLQGIQQAFNGVVTIVATLCIMFFLSVPIGLVVALLTPVSLLITWLIARASETSFKKERDCQGRMLALIDETYQNQALINVFAQNDAEVARFSHLNSELYDVGQRAQFAGSLTNPGTRLVNNIVYALVALVACLNVMSGTGIITIGLIQVFLSYASQFARPFYEITGVLTQVQTAIAGARRVCGFLDLKNMPQETHDPQKLSTANPLSVGFQKVSFGYVRQNPVVKDVSWLANAKENIALVGPTGCGKTTMLSLLMRFYDIDTGDIHIDNVNVEDTTKAEVRNVCGIVLQGTWIFEGSVRDNIAYGCPGASDADVIKAAKEVMAHDFIEQLPQGYNTTIGSDNDPLSRGQRQLISIARVVLRRPSIVVLDEATSMIDTRTELLVQKALDKLMQRSTSITVAHRLSTVRNADCILVMNDGRIVERGSHNELIKQHGLYQELYESQWRVIKEEELSMRG